MKEFESDIYFCFNNQENILDDKQRLSGKLYVSNSNNIHIKYIGLANPTDIRNALTNQNAKSSVLYGQTSDGKRFTAHQCYMKNGYINFSESSFLIKKGEVLIGTLFFGEWLDDIDNIKINQGRVRFSYLEHWLGLFKVDDNYFEEGKKDFSVDLEQFNTNLNVEIDNNTILKTSSSWKQNVEFNKKLIFDVKQYLSYDFFNPISLKEYNQLNFKLQNFFRVILPKKDIFIEERYITVLDKEVEIYSSNKHYAPEINKVFGEDFLYKYNENTVNDILINWFNLQSVYGRIFDLLSSILSEKSFMYLEHSFLNIAQWYEGFCRIKYPTSDEEISKFKSKIENIVRQVSESEDKKFIEEITQFSYEAPLNKQLKKLFNDFNLKTILNINSKELDSLIYCISKHRNKLTHPTKDNGINFQQLIALKEILKYYTFIILIKTLKLNEDTHKVQDIKEKIKHYYAQFIERKAEDNN